MTVLEVAGLRKVYTLGEVEVQALRGVDLEVPEGELIVLLGHSGSGKSTLLNIVGGLDRATSGTVRYRDRDLTGADDADLTLFRRRHVGFVFQFFNLIPSLTARENVELVTEIADDPMAAVDALELVDVGEHADRFPSQLSGGQQQRVAIARPPGRTWRSPSSSASARSPRAAWSRASASTTPRPRPGPPGSPPRPRPRPRASPEPSSSAPTRR